MFRMRLSVLIATMTVFLVGAIALGSAQTANLEFTVARVRTAPTIDAVLSDGTWLEASQKGSKTVVDVSHFGNELTRYPRVAYLGYDDKALYVSFVNYVPDPGSLVTDLPTASHNDEIEIFLSPDGSAYHQLIITAGGVLHQNTQGAVKTQSLDVKYAVSIDDIAWRVEVAIPFESIGYTPKAGDQWTFNLNGRQVGAGDLWLSWNPTYGGFHNPGRFGTLTFGN